MRLLILGGTSEASALARALAGRADIAPVLSLAGRTADPAQSAIPVRIGGFGGPNGLAEYLEAECIGAVVDATHPFAAQISGSAIAACEATGVPLTQFTRLPWVPAPADDWRFVADLDEAAEAIGTDPQRVFLTSGRLGLASFKAAPQHRYLLRSIDPPPRADCPPACETLLARGPFEVESERTLMRRHTIDVVVSKNSGGHAGAAKLEAARSLGLRVIMVERPPTMAIVDRFTDLDEVLGWIEAHRSAP